MLAEMTPMALMILRFSNSDKEPKNMMVNTSVNGINGLLTRLINNKIREVAHSKMSEDLVGCQELFAAIIPNRNGAPQPMQFCLNHHMVSSLVK